MEAAVRQDARDDYAGWSSGDSADPDYPGARHANTGQLWDEHHKFFAALLSYLEYEGGRSQTYLPLPMLQGHGRMEETN